MKKHSGQQIAAKLRQADVELGKELTVPEVCKKIGMTEQTYYRWRQKYGGMPPAMTLPPRRRHLATSGGGGEAANFLTAATSAGWQPVFPENSLL